MREGFFGLNVSVRGLYSAQRGLDVVNHNLNNVNTPGYSRQVAIQTASRPMALSDGTGMLGTGSEVISVQRIRDEYLDFKYWGENVTYGEWSVKSELLSDIEAAFNEPSGSGFNKVLGDFYSSLQELAKDPSSTAVRAVVRERGVSVAKYFNSVAAHFEALQADVNDRVKAKVGEVNSLATQIQEINKQIYTSELDGNVANDLRDQRTVLVDKLSKVVNIEANEVVAGTLPSGMEDKHFVITIDGKALVDHYNISKLAANTRKAGEKLNAEDVENLCEVSWADGNTLNIKGGELRGLLDLRDGNGGKAATSTYSGTADNSPFYNGIPYYQSKLNQFVQTFAKAFNEGIINGQDLQGHVDGYGLDPDGDGPQTAPTGYRFFTLLGSDDKPISNSEFLALGATVEDRYSSLTAKNFSISEDIMNNTGLIAASSVDSQTGNIENLNALLNMRHNSSMFSEGAPEDFMQALVSTLGVDAQQAEVFASNQETMIAQLKNRRLSESGVSIDEEMTNMIKFQHAYNASAQMITTWSEVYDTLINRLGVR